jgi:hypothetical protein
MPELAVNMAGSMAWFLLATFPQLRRNAGKAGSQDWLMGMDGVVLR